MVMSIDIIVMLEELLDEFGSSHKAVQYDPGVNWRELSIYHIPIYQTGFTLSNISRIKPASVKDSLDHEYTGDEQCGLSIVTHLNSDQYIYENTDAITTKASPWQQLEMLNNKKIQFKSVSTRLDHHKGEWHIRAIYTYIIDQVLHLNINPVTAIILYDVRKFPVDKDALNIIIKMTKCIPRIDNDLVSASAVEWEKHIKMTRWPSSNITNNADYTLLLYLANCCKSDHSHFISTDTKMYRNIDTDRCMLPEYVWNKHMTHLWKHNPLEFHPAIELFDNRRMCNISYNVMKLMIDMDKETGTKQSLGSQLYEFLKPLVSLKILKDNYGQLMELDSRLSEAVNFWNVNCGVHM